MGAGAISDGGRALEVGLSVRGADWRESELHSIDFPDHGLVLDITDKSSYLRRFRKQDRESQQLKLRLTHFSR